MSLVGIANFRRFPANCAVVIPALNEEAAVPVTVRHWLARGFGRVRVVDNGSQDSTARVAREAGAEVVVESVRGYGAAAWRGMQGLPEGIDWVLFSSADGSDALEADEMADWARAADGGAELMLGDRSTDAASRRAMNLSQRVCTWIFCRIVRWGWGVRFGDVGSLRALRSWMPVLKQSHSHGRRIISVLILDSLVAPLLRVKDTVGNTIRQWDHL